MQSHSNLSISFLHSVYQIVSLFFSLILKFKYFQITIGFAFSFSILFRYSLSEFHWLFMSFLWSFLIFPNCSLFFFISFTFSNKMGHWIEFVIICAISLVWEKVQTIMALEGYNGKTIMKFCSFSSYPVSFFKTVISTTHLQQIRSLAQGF